MTAQKYLCVGALLLGSAMSGPAWSQTASFSSRFLEDPPQTTARVAPTVQAPPMARRQPRAADVPPAKDDATGSTSDPAQSDDEALRRKISGICRGC